MLIDEVRRSIGEMDQNQLKQLILRDLDELSKDPAFLSIDDIDDQLIKICMEIGISVLPKVQGELN